MLWAVCRQQHSDSLRTAYTDEHFIRKKQVFLQLPTSFHLASLQSPTSSDRQVNFSRRQPSRQTSRAAVQLFSQSKSQPPGLQQHSFLQIYFILQPLPCFPATFHKKTEPSAQFFPLYISSTFPGLYNPQFSSCNTKPKCLRMPAKSGSLLLSSVITGLSFSSHSRLNSISLLPRPL